MLWGGNPAAILEAAEEGKVNIFISEDIVAEISQVLVYPKIEKVYRTETTRQELIEQVMRISEFATVRDKISIVKDHPSDNKIIECAIAAKADYIISDDKHLLNVRSYKKTGILSVNDFLKLIE